MIVWACHPRGDRIGLDESGAVAWFLYREAAMDYCKRLWPDTGEVIPIDVDQIRYEVEEQ